MSSKIIKGSSVLLLMAGVFFAVAMLFHPDITKPDFASKPAWIRVHILLGLSSLTGLIGLAGVYSVMVRQLSTFGHVAFGLTILGNILMTGMMVFVETTLLPVLAREPAYQPLLAQGSLLMNSSFGAAIIISLLISALGALMLAGYLVKVETISPVNGILFLGAPLATFTPPLPFAIGIIGGVLFGIALAWFGLSIRMGIGHQTLAEELRIQDECFIEAGGHA